MEVLAIFAVAGNVLQFVEVGVKLVIKSVGCCKSGRDQLTGEVELHRLVVSLGQLNKQLGDLVASESCGNSAIDENLRNANKDCIQVTNDFLLFLEKLNVKGDRSFLRGIKVVVKQRWYKDQAEVLEERLKHIRANLTLAYLAYTHLHLSKGNKVAIEAVNDAELQILKAMEGGIITFGADLTSLNQEVQNLRIDETASAKAFKAFTETHSDSLECLTGRLNALLADQNEEFTVLSQKIDSIISHHHKLEMKREVQLKKDLREQVLKTLSFPQLEERHEHIPEAHKRTFIWAIDENKGHDKLKSPKNNFVRWLRSRNSSDRIYWICGKAGSGKSTMMRYLTTSDQLRGHLAVLATGKHILKAAHFFWNPGHPMQKSLEGFVRTILLQLFRDKSAIELKLQKPGEPLASDIILSSISNERRTLPEAGYISKFEWPLEELTTTLWRFLEQTIIDCRILLFVDGLDELEGNMDRKQVLISLLDRISSYDHVKICVSSRPWNIFNFTYLRVPQLRLEELTHGDIQLFVEDKLERDWLFVDLKEHDEESAEKLVADVVEKANGVFLWVHLVVQALLQGLRDGDNISTLIYNVERMPADLNSYFTRMMDGIEPQYRRESSALLQLSIELEGHLAVGSIGLFELAYVQLGRPDFALQPEFRSIDWHDKKSVDRHIELMKRRLNSRCMGLLETHESLYHKYPRQHIVTHLHRTVKEFLQLPEARKRMETETQGSYSSLIFLCNAYLANVMSLKSCYEQNPYLFFALLGDLVATCLHAESWPHESEVSEQLVNKLWAIMESLSRSPSSCFREAGPLGRLLLRWIEDSTTRLMLTIAVGSISHVKAELTTQIIRRKTHRPVLDYALNVFSGVPNLHLVNLVLERGGDPNTEWEFGTPWTFYLSRLRWAQLYYNTDPKLYHQAIIAKLIEYGAATEIPLRLLQRSMENLDQFQTWSKSEWWPKPIIRLSYSPIEKCSKKTAGSSTLDISDVLYSLKLGRVDSLRSFSDEHVNWTFELLADIPNIKQLMYDPLLQEEISPCRDVDAEPEIAKSMDQEDEVKSDDEYLTNYSIHIKDLDTSIQGLDARLTTKRRFGDDTQHEENLKTASNPRLTSYGDYNSSKRTRF